jgi:arylsulfatase A-like enzyme
VKTQNLIAILPLVLALSAAAKQPNILYVLVDDMGWADNGFHDPAFYSPTIERLAEEGVWLDQHYVQPQCTPTRVALLTGRYPGRFSADATVAGGNTQVIPLDTTTLADLLRGAGYATGLFGKWHLASRPQQNPSNYGFDRSYGSLAGACGVYDHRYRLTRPEFSDTWHRNGVLIPGAEKPSNYTAANTNLDLYEGYHSTDLITDEVIDFISEKRTKPFFAYLAYTAVHDPLSEESKWFNDPEGKIAQITDKSRRLMAASVYHLDYSIKRVIQALETNGQRKNTLVIFSSDNGGILGARGGSYPAPDPKLSAGYSSNGSLRGEKSNVYEGGIRVPAFVNWPGTIAPGGSMRDAMHMVDWFPTLARVAGIEMDAKALQLDGIDVWDQITKGTPMPERDIYINWGPKWQKLSLRRGDWKVLRNGSDAAWQLFKITNADQQTADPADPNETTDLAAKYPERLKELQDAITAQHARDNTARLVSCWLTAPKAVEGRETFSMMLNSTHNLTGVDASDFEVTGARIQSLDGSGKSYTLNLTAAARDEITVMFKANAVTSPSQGNDRSPVAGIPVGASSLRAVKNNDM